MTTQLEGPRMQGGHVPPHNLDAEDSVLGAVMLSPDAANVALEKLTAEDFYKPAHQLIFEAIVSLFDGNQPIDAITVADHLRRTNQLERIGGVGYITALLDGVPTTSNIGYYAITAGSAASVATVMGVPVIENSVYRSTSWNSLMSRPPHRNQPFRQK